MMFLSLGEDGRAWKGFDRDAQDRLCQKGLIENPKNRNKSVVLTAEGIKKCKRLFERHFGERARPLPQSPLAWAYQL